MRLGRIIRAKNMDVANVAHGIATGVDSIYTKYIKRAFDIAISGVALVVTLPINAAIAVGTYLDVGRPIFFKQTRIGKDGKPFVLIKFRNMTNDTDENGVLLPPDQRVTDFGRIMRSTSLDELLNFWSIFKGDMSVIGPRPLLPEYTERYCDYHKARLSVKPGLECPPNPALDDATSWEGQFNNDVWYAENVSFITDVKKAVRLFEAVFNKRSSKTRGAAERPFFIGYDETGRAISINDVPLDLIESVVDGEEGVQ